MSPVRRRRRARRESLTLAEELFLQTGQHAGVNPDGSHPYLVRASCNEFEFDIVAAWADWHAFRRPDWPAEPLWARFNDPDYEPPKRVTFAAWRHH